MLCIIFLQKGYCTEYNYTLLGTSDSVLWNGSKNLTISGVSGRIALGSTDIKIINQPTDSNLVGKTICFKLLNVDNNNTNDYFCIENIQNNVASTFPSSWDAGNYFYHNIKLSVYERTEVIEEPPVEEPEEPQEPQEPIEPNKEDFLKAMYIGLVEVGILIFMLFFKWCFPMKGAKKNGK